MKKLLCLSLLFCILTTLLCIYPSAAEPPEVVGVGSATLVNSETGNVVYSYNSDVELSPAATPRLMTALVTYKQLKNRMDEAVTITADMVKGYENYNSFYLSKWRSLSDYVGKKITVRDLYELALVYSADDAVQALAVIAYGNTSLCIAAMNDTAKSLGMTRTEYTNAVSAGAGAKTTGADTAKLASAFYKENVLFEIASSSSASITVGTDKVTVYNRNLFNSTYYGAGYYDSTVSGLLYHSSAGCLVSAKASGNLSYVCVIMGADTTGKASYSDGTAANAFTVSSSLLSYGIEGFGFAEVLSPLRIFADIPVTLSKQADFVTAVPRGNLVSFLPTSIDLANDITYEVHLNVTTLEAPVKLGASVGYVDVIYEGEILGSVELVTNAAISKSLTREFSDFLLRVISYPVTIVIIVFVVTFFFGYILYSAQKETERKENGDLEE